MTTFTNIPKQVEELLEEWTGAISRRNFLKGSGLLDQLSRILLHPSPAKFVKAAWAARALRRDALAAARVTNKTEEIEALGDVLVGAETLRSDLMRARVLMQEDRNVLRN